ncbi:MAG: PA14 domain-containing protein, partial [Casimicrobium sp.]
LTANQTYSLRLDYYERAGQASIKLLWSTPTIAKAVIPASAFSCCSDRGGVSARMSQGRELNESAAVTVGGREINYNWGAGAAKDSFGNDNFTIRWRGTASPKTSGRYTFYVTADDGVRLRVNGQTLIDKWFTQGATTYSAQADVQAGSGFAFELDYFEAGGLASVKLEWESADQPREVIPMGAFFAQFGIGERLNASTVQNTASTPVTPPTASKTYFVATNGNDNNNGSQSAPFRSIQKAVDAVQPGEAIEIASGTYALTAPIRMTNKNGTSAKPISIVGKDGAVIRWGTSPSFTGYDGLLSIVTSSYVTVKNLRFENSPLFGVLVQGSRQVTLEKNATTRTIASAIFVNESFDVTVRGNDASDFCIKGNRGTPFNCQEGISISDTVGFDVDGNRVHDAYQTPGVGPGGGEGIDVKGASSNGTVRNNVVYNLVQLGIYLDGYAKTVENVKVFNNIVYNTSAGIVLGAEAGGAVKNVDIFNNLVYNNGLDGISFSGYCVNGNGCDGPRENIRIYHNTVVGNGYRQFKPAWAGKDSDYGFGIHIGTANVRSISIANNLVFDNSLNQIVAEDIVDRSRFTVDTNLSFPTGRTNIGEVIGNNAIVVDPKLVDRAKGNFRLTQQSPVIGKASSASAKPQFDL